MLNKQQNLDAIEKFSENLEIEGRSLWQDARIRFMRNKAAMVSLVILVLITLAVIFLILNVAHYAYDDTDWYALQTDLLNMFLGTHSLGRDLCSDFNGRAYLTHGRYFRGICWSVDWYALWRCIGFWR